MDENACEIKKWDEKHKRISKRTFKMRRMNPQAPDFGSKKLFRTLIRITLE
jgi:hypothetical protein